MKAYMDRQAGSFWERLFSFGRGGTGLAGALFFLLAAAISSAGCGPSWTVVRSSGPPSALAGAGPITVAFDYSRLQVGDQPEQAYVQSKLAAEPDFPTKWQDLKTSYEQHVLAGLAETWPKGVTPAPPGAGVGLVVIPTSLTMGHYMVVYSTPTILSTTLDWVVGGQVAEEIAVTGNVQATGIMPSIFQHIPPIAALVGRSAGKYLASRK
jgi:hypothetical protein